MGFSVSNRHIGSYRNPTNDVALARLQTSYHRMPGFIPQFMAIECHWNIGSLRPPGRLLKHQYLLLVFNINIKTPHIHTFYPRNSQDKVNQKTDSPVVKYFLLGDPQRLVRWFSSYPLIRFPGPVPVPPCCCWPTTTSWTPWSCGWPPQRRSMRPGGMAVYGCGVEFAILICTTSLGFFNYFFWWGLFYYTCFFFGVCVFVLLLH